MSEEKPNPPLTPESSSDTKDSFGIPVKKSPLVVFALLQIPIVIIMAAILYFMYQARQN